MHFAYFNNIQYEKQYHSQGYNRISYLISRFLFTQWNAFLLIKFKFHFIFPKYRFWWQSQHVMQWALHSIRWHQSIRINRRLLRFQVTLAPNSSLIPSVVLCKEKFKVTFNSSFRSDIYWLTKRKSQMNPDLYF